MALSSRMTCCCAPATAIARSWNAAARLTNAPLNRRLPELRDQLIEACHGNFIRSPRRDDVSAIRRVLRDGIPLDVILGAVRSKTDRKIFPANEPAVSWGEERLLRAIAERYARFTLAPAMASAWGSVRMAPGRPVEMSDALPAVQVSPTPEDAPAAVLDAPWQHRQGRASQHHRRVQPATGTSGADASTPQRQAEQARPWFAGQQTQEVLSDEAIDEFIAGWRDGNIAWPRRMLGPAPGEADCRVSRAALRRNGL
jgi:hypothetical protein